MGNSRQLPTMAIDPDPSKLETTLTLRDDRRVRVRAIRPADASMDRAFFDGLSEQSRYMRCMQHLAELTPRLVQQFTQIDDTREMALVATGSGGAIMEVFFYWTTLVSYPTIVPKEREPAPGQRHDDDARPAPLTSDVRRLIL